MRVCFGFFLVLGNPISFTLVRLCHLIGPRYNFTTMLFEHVFALAINLLHNLAINLLYNLAINLLHTLAINLLHNLAINLLHNLAINLLYNLAINLLYTLAINFLYSLAIDILTVILLGTFFMLFQLKFFANITYPCLSALIYCLTYNFDFALFL